MNHTHLVFGFHLNRRPLVKLAVLFLLGICLPANCQSDFTRIYGTEDQSVLMLALTGTLGQVDATALAEIQQYRKAIGATQWAGMQGTGTISQGNEGQLNATLSILGGNSFRLDVAAPQGVRSVRITDFNGQIQESDGRKHILPAANAKNGILAFPHLLSSTFPDAQSTVLDHGIV